MQIPVSIYLVFVILISLPVHVANADAAPDGTLQPAKLFASVGTSSITDEEYNQALQQASRRKFYHGTPPEGAMDQLRHEVAREVITRELLLQEAERLGMTANEEKIKANIAEFDQRYADSTRWQQQRASLVVSLSRHYREEDLLSQLEARQRNVAPPGQNQLQEYYRTHQEKLTEPAQHRLSLILLRVDPSASNSVWDAALAEGNRLVSKLADGAGFAELAKLHSGDGSARQGGDMGYLHTGMLSPAAEEVIAGLQPGEVSVPVRLLEGIAIFRLEDRKTAQLRKFTDVSERARDLWMREQSSLAWDKLKEELWEKTEIRIHNASLDLDNQE